MTAYALSLMATLPALAVIGLVPVSLPALIGSVIVGAFGGPVIAFAFGTLASNTIEGLALSKIINLFVLGPAVVIALIPRPGQFVAGVIPMFWPAKTYVAGSNEDPMWILYMFVGVVVHLVVLAVLGKLFIDRAD